MSARKGKKRSPKRYDSDLGLLILDLEEALGRVAKVGREITLTLEQHLEDLDQGREERAAYGSNY